MEQRQFSDQVADRIGELRQEHQQNEQCDYSTKDQSGQLIPIRPVFMSEFIVYNSLYQKDWPACLDTGCVENHPERRFSESRKQSKLERFLNPYIEMEPRLLYDAFLPIRNKILEGDWTEVVSDSHNSGISDEKGKRFFRRLRELQTRLSNTDKPSEFQVDDSLFNLIGECRHYIYLVRNNIFHGSKTLRETYDPEQRKRICIYLTFLRCIINLFFLVCDRHLLRTASHFSTEA